MAASHLLRSTFGMHCRSVLVVAASSGLGAHFARTLARAGAASVVLAARRVDRLAAVRDAIAADAADAAGCRVSCVPLDVGDLQSIRDGVDAAGAASDGGVVDVCINCAGIASPAAALDVEESQWDSVLDVNLKGNFFVAREVAARLVARERPGNIVNVCSILGLRPGSAQANYGASKAGLLHASKILANEVARHGIRVNCLCPGYFETEMNRDFFASEAGRRYLARIPPKRLGTLAELDGPLLLLASGASSFMTGTEIVVDLGHSNSNL